MIHNGEYYTYPAEKWDAAKCEKMAKRTHKDGLGTPYHFKGFLPSPYPYSWGKTRLNGGFTINGDWYEGVIFPLPEVAEGFKIITVPTWGYRIVKAEGQNND